MEQIIDAEQVTALGYCMRYAQEHIFDGRKELRSVVRELEQKIGKDSLSGLCGNSAGIANMAMPRTQEIFACLNRYRKLKV